MHFSDGATYGERTIERAITGTDEFYEEGAEWEPIAATDSETRTESSPSSTSSPTVPDRTLHELRRELEALEAENGRLREELERERARRRKLEETDEESNGLWASLLPR